MTIDELISILQEARERSPIGGQTVVHLCVQEVPYIELRMTPLDSEHSGTEGDATSGASS